MKTHTRSHITYRHQCCH